MNPIWIMEIWNIAAFRLCIHIQPYFPLYDYYSRIYIVNDRNYQYKVDEMKECIIEWKSCMI